MNQKINLKEIERKAYTSYHQDGVVDVTIAFTVLVFGAIMLGDMPWIGGFLGILAISLYAGLKKIVTIPRIGYVKFPQQRAQKITALTVVLGLVAFISPIAINNVAQLKISGLLLAMIMLVFNAFIRTKNRLSYKEGLVILSLYAFFVIIETLAS